MSRQRAAHDSKAKLTRPPVGSGAQLEPTRRKPPSKSTVLRSSRPVAVSAGAMVWEVLRQGRPKKPFSVRKRSSLSVVHTTSHVPCSKSDDAGLGVGLSVASASIAAATRALSASSPRAPRSSPLHKARSSFLRVARSNAAPSASGVADGGPSSLLRTNRYESAASPSLSLMTPRSRAVDRPPSTPARTIRRSASVYVRSHVRSVPGGNTIVGPRPNRLGEMLSKATRSEPASRALKLASSEMRSGPRSSRFS
mmetsp:Transcript_61867/g.122326  ORF Transcript_61867/g.122326 Transcript_61867/m.122326 type:complete len:253 (-) Transcript_61867:502-1260(-)